MSKKQPTITTSTGQAYWPGLKKWYNESVPEKVIRPADWMAVVARLGTSGITPKILNELLDCYEEALKPESEEKTYLYSTFPPATAWTTEYNKIAYTIVCDETTEVTK